MYRTYGAQNFSASVPALTGWATFCRASGAAALLSSLRNRAVVIRSRNWQLVVRSSDLRVVARGPGVGSLRAGTADRMPQCCSVEIFAQVHQGEKSVENTRFHFVGQMQSAGRRTSQHFTVVRDIADDFHLTRIARRAIDGFAAHFRARFFDLQGEMKQAEMHRFQRIRHLSLASVFTACG